MRFACVGDDRHEAKPGLSGRCPSCGSLVIAKCGDHRVWHWAHRGERSCDRWWERETDWHIGWKNRFPAAWQEIIRWSEDGEKHIADVLTPDGRAIEFQHSFLATDERRSRETFYKSMIWVVDGLRRMRDKQSFYKTLHVSNYNPRVFSGHVSECALLRDWIGRPVDVFLDFGASPENIAWFGKPVLWHLHPGPLDGPALLTPMSIDAFLTALHKSAPLPRLRLLRTPVPSMPRPLYGFEQYIRRRRQSRARF